MSVSYGVKMKQLHGHFALRTSARLLLSSIAALSFSTSIHAEQTLDNITVTANRMPSVNVLASNTVITRDDIDRLQINDLGTLLSRQTGIDMTNNGGIGKATSISIRGSNSSHVLVLVDGVKWHSATTGGPSIQDFPVEQIERIEIVRGPRSGIYGSEAIGGVIQIFTRKGEAGSVKPFAKLSYGTHNSKQAAAGVSGGDEKTTYNLSFNHQSTDGITVKEGKGQDPDKDGYRNNSISAKVNHQLTDKLNLGANFLRSEGFNQYDSGLNIVKGDSVQQIIGTNAALQVNDQWLASLQLSESRDQSNSFKNSNPDGTFNTRHRAASLTNIYELTANHTLNFGLDYDVDDVESTTKFAETSRDNKAAFISWQADVDKHGWLVSARHDDNEAFGHKNTGNAEYGYWLQDNLRITFNAGTAFKVPTFNNLYLPLTYGYIGNPDLLPEESKSFGAGINGQPQWGTWAVNVYQNEIKNLISYQLVSPGLNEATNTNKAKIKGIEFDLATVLAGWDVALNTSFLKPEDEDTGNILARRAQRLANVNLDKQWGAWSTGASWKLRGNSYEYGKTTTRLGGYGLLDLRVAYDLNKDWSVKADLSNVFNKEYETANNYSSLDRTVMFTLLYQP